jgi:pimeloyl-ACP methyl ester carboxylesterase
MSSNLSPTLRDNLFFLFLRALFISGILGVSFHSTRLYTPQLNINEAPPALDIVLALLTSFFTLEALWWRTRSNKLLSLSSSSLSSSLSFFELPQGRNARYCRLTLTFLSALSTPLLFILYLIGYRSDGALWTVTTSIALCFILHSIWLEESKTHSTNIIIQHDEDENISPKSPLVTTCDEFPFTHTPSSSSFPTLTSSSNSSSNSNCNCLDCCLPKGTSKKIQIFSCIHSSIWCLASIVLVLLLGGAGTIAAGWRLYPPRGQIYSISLSDYSNSPAGNSQRIHAWCTGPSTTNLPTLFLDFGGGGHSMSDVYGLQEAFNALGRRVCLYDPPGTGWSALGPGFNAEAGDINPSHSRLIATLLNQMGEKGPFIWIGSMDGGAERIYQLALERPDLVRALVPMQYGNPEFLAASVYFNQTQTQTETLAKLSLTPRLLFCDIIRFLGIQWGLVSLFVPFDANFVPKERQAEKLFLNLFHEGQWDMQCRILAAQVMNPSLALQPSLWYLNRSLASHIPVLAIDNPGTDPCEGIGSPLPGSDDCNVLRLAQTMNTAFMKSMTTMTMNSTFIQCIVGQPACIDWMGSGTTIPFVVTNVMTFLNSIGA